MASMRTRKKIWEKNSINNLIPNPISTGCFSKESLCYFRFERCSFFGITEFESSQDSFGAHLLLEGDVVTNWYTNLLIMLRRRQNFSTFLNWDVKYFGHSKPDKWLFENWKFRLLVWGFALYDFARIGHLPNSPISTRRAWVVTCVVSWDVLRTQWMKMCESRREE